MRRALEAAKAVYRRDGPLVRDVTAMATGAFLTVLAVKTPWSPMPRPVILVAGLIGSAALWWRRRRPVETTLVGVVAFVLSGNPGPVAVGLSTTASMRRDRVLVAVAALASVGFAVPVMADLGRFDLTTLIAGAAEAGAAAFVGAYIGTRRELEASLRDRAERIEAQRELRDERARVGERARIAREMHDVLAHKVSLIALHAGALEVNTRADPARAEQAAGLIRTTAHQALDELRSVLGVLRSADGRGEPAARTQRPDIGRLVESSRDAGVPAELHDELTVPSDLSEVTAWAAYRVVQEGLTNVHKHAPGASAVVALRGDERAGLAVSVTNRASASDPTAAPLQPGSGAGLVGLRERMRLIGGTLRCGPEAGGGWRLEAWLPWTGTGSGTGTAGTDTGTAARTGST